MQGLVGLDREKLWDAHGPRHAYAADVIAQKVHDHQGFGAVLGIRLQKEAAARILCRIRATRLRAFHGPGFDPPVSVGAKEQLGRARQDCRQASRLYQCAIAHRLYGAEGRIKCLRRTLSRHTQRKGEVSLIDVARADIVMHGLKSPRITRRIPVRHKIAKRGQTHLERRGRSGCGIGPELQERQTTGRRHIGCQPRLQRVTKFITCKTCKPKALCPRFIKRRKRAGHLVGRMGHDQVLGLRELAGVFVGTMIEPNLHVASSWQVDCI